MKYDTSLKWIVEALLMSSQHPLTLEKIQTAFEAQNRPGDAELREVIAALTADYQDRAVELVSLPEGYCFQTKPVYASWISRMYAEKPPRYSRALLETLAIIAYRQPVTRAEIEYIRGVAVSTSLLKSLLERGWVRVAGYKEVPGKPAVYATTNTFLTYFNLRSLAELPALEATHHE